MLYLVLKWLHILAAIGLVGAHASYGIWIVRSPDSSEVIRYSLTTIRWIDRYVAFPAVLVLLITGFAMAFLLQAWLPASWLHAALVLLAVVLLVHLTVYSPTLRRLVRLLDTEGTGSPAYQAAAVREKRVEIALTVAMIAIVFLMVVKPALWG